MNRLRGLWPYAVVGLAPLLLFAPFLLGWQVLYWGTVEFQFYPWQHLAMEALRSGHLPLWDPWLGNGAPLLANYQTAALYPPNWLALLLPLETAQAWLAALHLAWAGAGLVALARRLRLPTLGQAVAGLAFGLSQYLVARVSFLSINATVAWLPWVVCLAEYQLQLGERCATGARRASATLALAACVALQLLAGHAQTTWYTLLLAGAWCAWRLLSRGGPSVAARARTSLWLAVSGLTGALLAGVQLVPTAELLQQSPRATAAAVDFVMTYSFSPWRLLTLAAPDLLGNPARGRFFGYGNYWEDAIYIGLLPLLLALGVVLKSLLRRPARNLSRPPRDGSGIGPRFEGLPYFLLALAAISLLLGLGGNTPVFPFLYWHIPTFNLFQAPTRWLIWLVFALSLLAGLGAASWQVPRGWALYWTRLGAAAAAAMGLVGLLAWLGLGPSLATPVGSPIQAMGRALALAGLAAFLAAVLSLAHPGPAARWWTALVVAVVAADLLYADWALNPGAPPDLYLRSVATADAIRPVLQDHRLLYFPDDEQTVLYGSFVSFTHFGPGQLAYDARESLLADLSVSGSLASANNFDPLVSARYAGFMDVVSTTQSLPLLRLMNVAVVASPRMLDLERITDTPSGAIHFYRVPGMPQRVWTVANAIDVGDGPAALRAIASPQFDPAREVVLEPGEGPRADSPRTFTSSAAALTFSVDLAQVGWVVLADTDYPGWVAAVDGQAVVIRHADYAFRAVAVPAGAHTVVFDYQPASLRVGWLLTGLGAGLFLILGLWAIRGRPSTADTADPARLAATP